MGGPKTMGNCGKNLFLEIGSATFNLQVILPEIFPKQVLYLQKLRGFSENSSRDWPILLY
jgi:hypothetical protein